MQIFLQEKYNFREKQKQNKSARKSPVSKKLTNSSSYVLGNEVTPGQFFVIVTFACLILFNFYTHPINRNSHASIQRERNVITSIVLFASIKNAPNTGVVKSRLNLVGRRGLILTSYTTSRKRCITQYGPCRGYMEIHH